MFDVHLIWSAWIQPSALCGDQQGHKVGYKLYFMSDVECLEWFYFLLEENSSLTHCLDLCLVSRWLVWWGCRTW